MNLRPYQIEAIEALFDFWSNQPGNCLIVLPTGTGKSVVIAETCRQVCAWPDTKVVILTHVQELVGQNYQELMGLAPELDAGINSAGLGQRDMHKQITFCSIQSVWKHALKFGKIDIVIVDEAHLIPRDATTMYQHFLKEAWIANPYMKVVGTTATPFRLDSGRMDEGEGALFQGIAYDYSIKAAMEEGYLTPVVTRSTKTHFDVSKVGTRGGEFIAGELERAVDTEALNEAIVDEVIERAAGRRSWLLFCTGVKHATHIRDLVRARGFTCETITAKTPKDERRQIIADFKAGKITALASMNVLTTGFNAPGVDLLAILRPTKSAGLYIQMVGRGTRNVYAPGYDLTTREGRLAAIKNGPKPDCLVLDFGQNIERFGPIDLIEVKKPKKGEDGEAPVKVCPDCERYVPAGARVCPYCAHQFPTPRPKYVAQASQGNIISTNRPEWAVVTDVTFRVHEKIGSRTSMKVTYRCGLSFFDEWVCLEHDGFARQKAETWWRQNGGQLPVPTTVREGIARQGELTLPAEILVRPEGKFTRVVGRRGVLDVRGANGARLRA
jgi:DNA repair protein RadD